MSLYLAAYDEHNRVSAGGGATHEEERIEVVELSLAELASRADSGCLADLKALLLVQTLRLRCPDLFRPCLCGLARPPQADALAERAAGSWPGSDLFAREL